MRYVVKAADNGVGVLPIYRRLVGGLVGYQTAPVSPDEFLSRTEDMIASTRDRSGGLASIVAEGGMSQEVGSIVEEWADQNTEAHNEMEDRLLDIAESWREMSAEVDELDLDDHK